MSSWMKSPSGPVLRDRSKIPDRGRVGGEYSVGVRVERGDEEGTLVLFGYRQCDLEYWSGDSESEPVMELLGSEDSLDLPGFERSLDRFGRLFGLVG